MKNPTLKWYKKHSSKFLSRTASVDMSSYYEDFLAYIISPVGGLWILGAAAALPAFILFNTGLPYCLWMAVQKCAMRQPSSLAAGLEQYCLMSLTIRRRSMVFGHVLHYCMF